jgi:hypothetical protein
MFAQKNRRIVADMRRKGRLAIFALGLACLSTLALASCASIGDGVPSLSTKDASSTAEAVQFATSEAIRQTTRVAANASNTAIAQAIHTVAARERKAEVGRTSIASTAQARATAQAPATQTVRAQAFQTAHAQAEATVRVLNEQATQVYGPSDGALEQEAGDEVACDDTGVKLSDFVVEAKFRNPQAEPGEKWDYGIIFLNLGGQTQYRLILDSDGRWTLNLHGSGFDIENRDTTDLLDLSQGGSNTLKLFVAGDTGYLYLNGGYLSTLDLDMLGMGAASAYTHNVLICTGIKRGYSLPGRSTIYEGLSVWALP